MLRREQLAGEEFVEFLDLYTRVAELPPEAFTRVWTDPSAYCWLHRAYQLVEAHVSGGPLSPPLQSYCAALKVASVANALARHLVEFKRFVIALSHLAATDCRFRVPFAVQLPFVLPGTDLWLDGSGSVEVVAVEHGHLVLTYDGVRVALPLDTEQSSPVATLTMRRSPTARHDGCEVLLQPHALAAPGIDIAARAIAAGLGYQARHAALVVDALRVMERHAPETFRVFCGAMRIIALKPYGGDEFTNVSHSDFPGASVISAVQHPFELADALIHEFHHNVLFALEERGAFFADEDGISDERYYSPWRDDPRPLRGILLGIHVHVPVAAYWLSVLDADDVDAATIAYARDRVVRLDAQLALGVEVLERHATFSRFGRTVWDTLRHNIAALHARVAHTGLADDTPAFLCGGDGTIEPERDSDGRALTVSEVLAEHRQRHDPYPLRSP